jgi:hypothetical protein
VGAAMVVHVFTKFGDDFADYRFLFIERLDEWEEELNVSREGREN